MKLKKIVLISLLVASFSANASLFKLADVIFTKKGVTEALGKVGIFEKEVTNEVSSTVQSALDDLAESGKGSIKDLKELKSRLETTEDKKKYAQLMEILNRDPKKPNYKAPVQEDIVDAINNLVELSQRYALRKSSGLNACVPCVNAKLMEYKFKFVLIKKKGQSRQILRQMSSSMRSPLQMKQVATSRLEKQNFGELDTKYVESHEYEVLLYTSYVEDFGSELEKAFVKRLKKISKVSPGQFNMFDEANGHKFYNIFSTNTSDSDLRMWIDLLDETYAEMSTKNRNTMDAFYTVLQKKIDSETDPAEKSLKEDMLKFIKNNNCFAKK